MPSPIAVPSTVDFLPLIAADGATPIAWMARPQARGDSAVEPDRMDSMFLATLAFVIRTAAESGLISPQSPLLVTIPGDSSPHRALSQLFRVALANRLSPALIRVAIDVGDGAAADRATALAAACAARGIGIVLDRFAATPLALRLLARFTPCFILLDQGLVRAIDASESRRRMLDGVIRLARAIDVPLVATGIEHRAEQAALAALGIRRFRLDRTAPLPRPPRRHPPFPFPPLPRQPAAALH